MTSPVLIMGATSGIGRATLDEAQSRGLQVRAFARSADSLPASPTLETFQGNARDPDAVRAALEGVHAVIYALGIRERLAMLWEKETLFSETTEILLDQMQKAQVSRLLAVTGFGAGRSRDAMSFLERTGHSAVLGRPYADKTRQEELILQSDLDWTIVRPVILTKGARTGAFRVLRDPDTWRNGLISRKDVAVYLVDALEQKSDFRKDVVLAR